MPGITITSSAGALKNTYNDRIITAWSNAPGMSKKVKELEGYQSTGAGHIFAIEMKGNRAALGAVAESGTVQDAGSITTVQGTVTCKYNYRSFLTSGPAVARSLKGGSWSNVLNRDIMSGTRDLIKDWNRQFLRNGDGVITQAYGAGAASTSLVVDSCRHLEPGDVIESYLGSSIEIAATVVISDIDYLTRTCTLSAASTWSDNSNIYRTGQYNSGTPKEIMGLQKLIGNSSITLQNIARGSYAGYRSFVDATGGPITRTILFQANAMTERLSGESDIEIWSNRAVREAAFMLVQPGIQFERPDNLELAFVQEDDPIKFGGKNWPVDEDCPNSIILGVNWNFIKKITEKPMGIGTVIDAIDSTYLRTANKDEYSGFISVYDNPVCINPRSCYKITGITEEYTQ